MKRIAWNKYWTIEKCHEEALKWKNRKEFKNNSSRAYEAAVRLKCLNVVCEHMPNPNMNVWNVERCLELMKNYETIRELRLTNKSLYGAIHRLKLTDEMNKILKRTGNRFNKCIYSYEFSDNHVYVGLTYNIEEREKNRKKDFKDSVVKYMNLTGLTPIRKQLTDYIPVDEASVLEGVYVEKYKNEGWIILNQAKTGGIGGYEIKLTKEVCANEALKYNTKVEFKNGSGSICATATKHGWINDICQHMIEIKKPNNYFSKEKCREISNNYNDLATFIKENVNCYTIMKRNNWLEELTSHMIDNMRKPNNYYSKEYCHEVALKYNTKTDFINNEPKVYDAARKQKIINEICSHMTPLNRKRESYTFEYCQEIALKFEYKPDFIKNNANIVKISREKGWLDDICSHMTKWKKEAHWTFDRVKEEALKFTTISDFKTNSASAYAAALKNNWNDIVCSHMIQQIHPNGYWTKEKCKEIALKYNTIQKLREEERKAYEAIKRNKWQVELYSHMERMNKPQEYWTYDICKNEALKYDGRYEFKCKCVSAYKACKRNSWLDEFFPKK
jgi:hypothetical protein